MLLSGVCGWCLWVSTTGHRWGLAEVWTLLRGCLHIPCWLVNFYEIYPTATSQTAKLGKTLKLSFSLFCGPKLVKMLLLMRYRCMKHSFWMNDSYTFWLRLLLNWAVFYYKCRCSLYSQWSPLRQCDCDTGQFIWFNIGRCQVWNAGGETDQGPDASNCCDSWLNLFIPTVKEKSAQIFFIRFLRSLDLILVNKSHRCGERASFSTPTNIHK